MTEERPEVSPAGRYTIARTCALLGIGRTTLYRHTEAGHIKSQRRKGTGRPFYTGLEIIKFWQAAY